MKKKRIFLNITSVVFILILINSYITGADPGHGAASIGPGNFEPGNYAFLNNLTVGGSNFFVNNGTGRVGIGTLNPIQTLDVRGTQYVSGNVGIGITNPTQKLVVSDITSNSSIYIHTLTTNVNDFSEIAFGVSTSDLYHGSIRGIRTGAGSTGDLAFLTQNTGGALYSTLSEKMRLTATGNLGIGTTSPTQKLDVRGNQYISGNIGIGTTSPGSNLQVHKSTGSEIAISNTASGDAKLFIGYDSTGGGGTRQGLEIYRTYGNSAITFQNNQNGYLLLNPAGGNVGIGTTSPTQKLDVRGNQYISGNVGIGTTNPLTKLHVSRGANGGAGLVISGYDGGSAEYNYRADSVLQWHLDSNNLGGAFVIYPPSSSENAMLSLKISGYDYESGEGFWEVNLGGYRYSSGDSWINTNAEFIGTPPFRKVSFGKVTTSGDPVIILGDSSDSGNWDYPQINVDVVISGYGSQSSYVSGWAGGLTTNTSNLTVQSIPVIKTFVDSSGKFGIGTTSPTQKLDVRGSANFSGTIWTNNGNEVCTAENGLCASSATANISGAGTINYVSKFTAAGKIGNSIIYDNGTNVGIGTTNPTQKLDVRGNAYLGGNLDVIDNILDTDHGVTILRTQDVGGSGLFLTTNHYSNDDRYHILAETGSALGNYNVFSVTHSGNIYTGGDINVAGGNIAIGNDGEIYDYGTNILRTPDSFVVDGNVGIGTNNPISSLEVAKADQVNGSTLSLTNSHNGAWGTGTEIIGQIDFRTNDASTTEPIRGKIKVDDVSTSSTYPAYNEMSFSVAKLNTLSEAMRINYEGNLGIGTISPTQKLDVRGNISLNGNVFHTGSAQTSTTLKPVSASDYGGWQGFAGWGVISDNGVNQQTYLFLDGIGNNPIFDVRTSTDSGSSWDSRLMVTQSGNVGIGTTNPTQKLNVVGDMNITGTAYVQGSQQVCTAENGLCGTAASGGGWTDDGTVVRLTTSTDNVGIGTTNAIEKLQVAGNVLSSNINTTGYNVYLGIGAGNSNTGTSVTAIGYATGYQNTGGTLTALGRNAGYYNNGNYLTAIGFQAGQQNTGNFVNAFGALSAYQNKGNYSNTLGYQAGQQNTGNFVNAFGALSAYQNKGNYSNTLGYQAGHTNLGDYLTAVGHNAGYKNIGRYLTAVGAHAGQSNKGNNLITLGHQAGYENLGNYSTALGFQSGYQNTGDYLTTTGAYAGNQNTGDYLTTTGAYAGYQNKGHRVISLGYFAGRGNNGSDVVAIGYLAGDHNTADSQFIVKQANVNAVPLIQGNFATGNVGIGTTNPTQKLDVRGNAYLSGGLDLGHASDTTITRTGAGAIAVEGNTIWTSANDGSGSGLDADLLDGHDSAYFMTGVTDNWVNESGDTMSGTLDMNTNLITNIGHANTDFTSGGGLNVAGNIGIGTTSATQKLDVRGNQYVSGNIGIGTTSPLGVKLEVYGAHTTTKARLYSTGNGGTLDSSLDLWASEPGLTYDGSGIGNNVLGSPNYGSRNPSNGVSFIRFQGGNIYGYGGPAGSNASFGAILTNSGNLGIGTSSPTQKLDVRGNAYLSGDINVAGGNIAIGNDGEIYDYGTNALRTPDSFYVGGNQYVTGNSYLTGNVGIGTTSATQKLDVNYLSSSGPGVLISGGSGVFENIALRLWDRGGAANNINVLEFGHNSSYVPGARIKSINPAVASLTGANLILETASDSSSTWNNNQLVLNRDGNVGVGTYSPTQKLNVVGDMNITGTAYVQGSQQVCTAENGLCGTAASGGGWTDDGTVVRLTTSTDNVGIGTTNAIEKLQVAGNVLSSNINTTGYNVYLGIGAGNSNTGTSVTAIGYATGYQNTGSILTALGRNAGYQNTGSSATLIGYQAGQQNNGPTFVTATGYQAGSYNKGTYLTAMGAQTGYQNIGNFSTFMGYYSGMNNNGNYVSGFGPNSARSNNGSNVVAIGYQAGYHNTADSQFIVKQANVNAVPLIQGNFATGNVGIGTTNPTQKLDVRGNQYVSGNIGVGTTNPTESLHIYQGDEKNGKIGISIDNKDTSSLAGAYLNINKGSSNYPSAGINLSSAGNQRWRLITGEDFGQPYVQSFRILNQADETKFMIQQSGNIGVGTTSPTQKLDVNGDVNISSAEPTIYLGGAYITRTGDHLIISD